MDMIEKVARAIADANMEDFEEFRALHEEMARAAIEAMKEPSQNMIDAIDDSDVYSFWSTYQDAIDAALGKPV